MTFLRRIWADGILLGLLVACIVGSSFLTWVQSGKRARNSFEVVRSADTLGFLDGYGGSTTATIWYGVPMLAGVAVALMFLGRRTWAAWTSVALAIVTIVASWVAIDQLPTSAGPKVSLGLGLATLFVALSMEFPGRRTFSLPRVTRSP